MDQDSKKVLSEFSVAKQIVIIDLRFLCRFFHRYLFVHVHDTKHDYCPISEGGGWGSSMQALRMCTQNPVGVIVFITFLHNSKSTPCTAVLPDPYSLQGTHGSLYCSGKTMATYFLLIAIFLLVLHCTSYKIILARKLIVYYYPTQHMRQRGVK